MFFWITMLRPLPLMNKKFSTRLLCTSLLLIVAGACSLWIENMFYQSVDVNGWLHESLFLPVGAFSLLSGFILLVLFLLSKLINLIKARR